MRTGIMMVHLTTNDLYDTVSRTQKRRKANSGQTITGDDWPREEIFLQIRYTADTRYDDKAKIHHTNLFARS